MLPRGIQGIGDAQQVPGEAGWSARNIFAVKGDIGDAVTSQLRQWAGRFAVG